jgi:hypothetical protein
MSGLHELEMPHSTTPTPLRIERALACRYRIADHREAWPRILPGLEKLHAQYVEQDWDIEGIRLMLDEERALLLTDDNEPGAFAVVRFDEYAYNPEEMELYVFLLWHKGGDVIERYQPHLDFFALRGGAKYLRFYSRRPAFLRVAKRAGYQPRGIEYVKELSHG